MSREHWSAKAERVYGGPYLGEDDNGDWWWAPAKTGEGEPWVERFDPRYVVHCWRWLRSRLARKLVFLEPLDSVDR